MLTIPRTPARKPRPLLPLAVALLAVLGGCSPDSSVSAPTAPSAPAKLLGLDPLVSTTTSTVTTTVDGTTGLVSTTLYSVVGLLSCPSQDQITASKVIGPLGGSLVVGDHELVVPAGALSQNVTISGTRVSGSVAEVDFQPHGLKFAKPATLRLSYSVCKTSQKNVQSIVYVDDAQQILESPQSTDDAKTDKVTAWINHFSGYAVATRTAQ